MLRNDMNYSKSFRKMQYIFQKKLDFFEVFCEKTAPFRVKAKENSRNLSKSPEFSRKLKKRSACYFVLRKGKTGKKALPTARFPSDNIKKGKKREKMPSQTGRSQTKCALRGVGRGERGRAVKAALRHIRRREADCQARTSDAPRQTAKRNPLARSEEQKAQK